MNGGGRLHTGFIRARAGTRAGAFSRARSSRRARALLLVTILTLGVFGAVVSPAPVAAQDARAAPWFGPADRQNPADGWTFRVPVVITNDQEYTMRDHVVAVEIDFLEILTDAGWLNETNGGVVVPRSFTLDVASIRVVEYERGYADFKDQTPRATPHVFYPSLFEERLNGRQFDAERTPIGTLVWRLNGITPPEQVRFYMVYFKSAEYGPAPATEPNERSAADLELEAAAAEAFASGGPGQVFYFRTNGQSRANRVDLMGLHHETRVFLYKYENNKFTPFVPDGVRGDSLWVNASRTLSVSVPQNAFLKVVADKPVLLADRGKLDQARTGSGDKTYGGGAFAMAAANHADRPLGGTFAGTRFILPVYTPEYWVSATRSGTTNVEFVELNSDGPVGRCTLSASTPACSRTGVLSTTGDVRFMEVTADKPVLIQYGGDLGQIHQAPAKSGAPTGTEFSTFTRRDDVYALVGVEDATVRVYDPLKATDQIHPLGPFTDTPPGPVTPGCENRVALKHNASFPQENPYLTISVDATGARSGHVAVLQGGPEGSTAGFFTGRGASRILATGPIGIAGHFDETNVNVVKCGVDGVKQESFSISRDYVDIRYGQEPSSTWYEIRTSKPVSVFATTPVDAYARFIPGRLVNPDVDVGALEFRGHLVDVRATDRTFKTTGPDVPVNFSLVTMNLGRWLGETNLQDTVRITCESDQPSWTIEGCDQTVRLNSFETERLRLTVTPVDADPDDGATITVRATSEGTPSMTAEASLRVVVEVTYGVGTWFDVEGGSKTIDPPVSVDAGSSHDYQIVLKNMGSVNDAFELERLWVADAGQWLAKLTLKGQEDGEELERVELAPGEKTTLTLRVSAPADPVINVPPDLIVKATSISDAASSDKVTSLTRIRADIKFAVSVDARTKLGTPGEPVNFTLDLTNNGTDLISVTLAIEGILPEGWSARLVDEADAEKTSFSLTPGVPERANLTVIPPEDERAGSLTTVRIAAETTAGDETRRTEESATVVVRHVHDVDVAPFAETVTAPGDTAEVVLDLTNLGNGDELIEVLPQTIEPLWTLDTPEGAVVRVARGDSARLPVTFTVPEATPGDLYNVNFTLRLSREAETNVTVPVRVPHVQQLAFDVPVDLRVTPGQAWSFPVDVRNTGNVPGVASLSVSVPDGWGGFFDPPTVDLAAGRGERVTLVVNATPDAENGPAPVTLEAAFEDEGTPNVQDATVRVARPALYLGSPTSDSETRRGETFIVTVPVGNRGEMEAKDVRVALVVNGKEVDAVTLGRVGTGDEQLAVLSWDVDERVRDVQVVLNPDKDNALVDAAPNEGKVASVSFAKPFLGVPAPGVVVVVLASALAVALASSPRRFRR